MDAFIFLCQLDFCEFMLSHASPEQSFFFYFEGASFFKLELSFSKDSSSFLVTI